MRLQNINNKKVECEEPCDGRLSSTVPREERGETPRSYSTVVENIKEIRLNKGISQKLLADALNVDNAVISNIETGKRELKVSELEIIANCLEVEVIDLFTYPQKYVEKDSNANQDEPVEAVLQIKLRKDKKEQVLRLVFGDNNLEILNK